MRVGPDACGESFVGFVRVVGFLDGVLGCVEFDCDSVRHKLAAFSRQAIRAAVVDHSINLPFWSTAIKPVTQRIQITKYIKQYIYINKESNNKSIFTIHKRKKGKKKNYKKSLSNYQPPSPSEATETVSSIHRAIPPVSETQNQPLDSGITVSPISKAKGIFSPVSVHPPPLPHFSSH